VSLSITTSGFLANSDQARWFETEVLPHESALRNWLRSQFPTLGDRDDLVQESYLRLWRARIRGPIVSPKSYLFVTARNLALNRLRHLGYDRESGETGLSTVLDDAPAIPEKVSREQEFGILARALQSLPERCREVFVLRRIHGLSQKEIAARMGISEKTVEAQSFVAMKKCIRFFRDMEHTADSPPALSPGTNGNSR
jgi:RNA polymerase sigma factor (sigma-70 family)